MSHRILFTSIREPLFASLAGFGFALASGCGGGGVEVTFDDEAYAEALEYVDINSGEACVPDMETYIPGGNGDHGGDTAQGVPTTNPDEDRRGGDDRQWGGNQSGNDADADADGTKGEDGTCDGTGSGSGDGTCDGTGSGGESGQRSGSSGESGQQQGSSGEGGQQGGNAGENGHQYGSGGESGQQSGDGSANTKLADDLPDHEYGAGCDATGCCMSTGDLERDRDRIRCRCRLRVRDGDPSDVVLPECCEEEEEYPPVEYPYSPEAG